MARRLRGGNGQRKTFKKIFQCFVRIRYVENVFFFPPIPRVFFTAVNLTPRIINAASVSDKIKNNILHSNSGIVRYTKHENTSVVSSSGREEKTRPTDDVFFVLCFFFDPTDDSPGPIVFVNTAGTTPEIVRDDCRPEGRDARQNFCPPKYISVRFDNAPAVSRTCRPQVDIVSRELATHISRPRVRGPLLMGRGRNLFTCAYHFPHFGLRITSLISRQRHRTPPTVHVPSTNKRSSCPRGSQSNNRFDDND